MPVTIDKGRSGTINWQISSREDDLALFSQKERNTAVRTALIMAGDYWLAVFLPMRFSQYAFNLGYHVSRTWGAQKAKILGKAIPYVGFTPAGGGPANPSGNPINGAKMVVVALQNSRSTATTTAGDFAIILKVPFGHAVRPETSISFTTVPANEVNRVAVEVAKALESILTSGRMTMRNSGPQRTFDGSVSRLADHTPPRRKAG